MNGLSAPALFGRMNALADSTRSRILLALERAELTVNELRAIMQLPQSTLSNHLKVLSNGGWVTSRAEGTSRLYHFATDSLDTETRKLWYIVRDQVAQTTGAEQDARRTRSVLAERTSKSQQFFSSSAGEWDRLRVELLDDTPTPRCSRSLIPAGPSPTSAAERDKSRRSSRPSCVT
jgi:Predicted transcriptional regulators